MSSAWNAGTGLWEVLGDGSGAARYRKSLLPAPNGANQATYFFQLWADDITATLSQTPILWSPACYWGLKFDSTFPDTSYAGGGAYSNFLGNALIDLFDPYDDCYVQYNASYDGVAFGDTDTSPGYARYYNGNGTTFTFPAASNTYIGVTRPECGGVLMPKNATVGGTAIMIWQVRTSMIDDSVYFSSWVNYDSINLAGVNLKNVSPDNVAATFPVSNYGAGSSLLNNYQIQGDTTGTNWRPSSGVMAFPTHFMVSWPFTTKGIFIKQVSVQYARLTV